jgi:alpha-glucosidase
MEDASPVPWWKTAVFYQVYPRSFAESAGVGEPGVGDLRGLIDRLDHLGWLGVDAIWLSPVFRSPMADFGYDVSDFCDIDPLFGTLADFDDLVTAVHARGMHLILDWVPNHTSEQHPWFLESRQDRTNPKADWYVWRDEPANNWLAAFPKGDTAWRWDDVRGQYHLRLFTPQQPDLDWDVPEVEAAMLDTLRFWLDRGVDGFRMDVVHLIGKELSADDPDWAVEQRREHVPFNDVEITHERLRRIRSVLDEYPGDRTSVGEVYLLDEEAIARYYGDGDELHMSFNFAFLWARPGAASYRKRIDRTLAHLGPVGAWPTWTLSNHDVPRHRTRHGGSEDLARVDAVMLLTLPGTPFVYQGEELGLLDADVPPDRVVDPGLRDGCRAPIPWDGSPLHGWTADPWLPFPPEADQRHPEALRADPASILHLYRDLLALRRSSPELQLGRFAWYEAWDGPAPDPDQVLGWTRGDRWLVVANFGDAAVDLPAGWEIRLATRSDVGSTLPGRAAVVAERA